MIPSEPQLEEAYIKWYFINKGVSPEVIENMDLITVNNIMEIDNQMVIKSKIDTELEKQKQRIELMKHGGTSNQGQVSTRHRRVK